MVIELSPTPKHPKVHISSFRDIQLLENSRYCPKKGFKRQIYMIARLAGFFMHGTIKVPLYPAGQVEADMGFSTDQIPSFSLGIGASGTITEFP